MEKTGAIFFTLIIILFICIIVYRYIDYNTFTGTRKGKYFLGLGAIFKNEAHILREWIEHYKDEEVSHIYLVNDHSTDDYEKILQPYIDEGYVTLYHVPDNHLSMSQQRWAISNIFFNISIKECKWFMHLDLDEFMSSRDHMTIKRKIDEFFRKYDFIYVPWLMFGSNGLEKHPESAIQSFTKRMKFEMNPELWMGDNILGKTIYRSKRTKVYDGIMPIHAPNVNGKYVYSDLSTKLNLFPQMPLVFKSSENNIEDYHLIINHYRLQSREAWKKKTEKGDADFNEKFQNRVAEKFDYLNKFYNQVEDTNLRDKTIKRKGIR